MLTIGIRATSIDIFRGKWRRYPCSAANIVGEVPDRLLNSGNDLYSAGARADDGHVFILWRGSGLDITVYLKWAELWTYFAIIILIPIRAMQQFPLEIFQAGDRWPFPFVQNSSSGQENVTRIRKYIPGSKIFDLQLGVPELGFLKESKKPWGRLGGKFLPLKSTSTG